MCDDVKWRFVWMVTRTCAADLASQGDGRNLARVHSIPAHVCRVHSVAGTKAMASSYSFGQDITSTRAYLIHRATVPV